MKMRVVLGGLVAAVLLVACAAPGAQTGAARSRTCPGNSCDVEVRVVMVGGQPAIQIDADELRFPRGNQDSTIVWKLKDSPQWTFKETSIAPHTAAPATIPRLRRANEASGEQPICARGRRGTMRDAAGPASAQREVQTSMTLPSISHLRASGRPWSQRRRQGAYRLLPRLNPFRSPAVR